MEGQTDRQTYNGKTICPKSFDAGHKNKNVIVWIFH